MTNLARVTLTLLSTGVALACVGTPSSAWALTPSKVTIHADGLDLHGSVSSTRPACVGHREIIVIKQVGSRGGGDDLRFASDTTENDGSWSIGNTGTPGRFFAKVRKTAHCAGDTSKTIRAVRNP
ncbi:hypothetical protein [Nocardioides panacisoli]|uniref:Uncharacterized protein n=1 Tax=Nocardioides panacisoli TaxID=627624 RepID=A0ABP7ISK5_9ACTN